MTTRTYSFRALDVGFDLRTTGETIARPESVGCPSETITVLFDGGETTGPCCDCGAALRRAGYTVSQDWFAGRKDWGRPLVLPGQADRDLYREVKAQAAAGRAGRVAIATPKSPAVYDVSYPGSQSFDRDVSYDYLRGLAARGYTVQVGGVADTPAHTIPAEKVEA